MRYIFIMLDVILIVACACSVIRDIQLTIMPKYILFPMFIGAIKIGALLGSKFYEDWDNKKIKS